MAYEALARKYRPQTFEDFVGQEFVARTLKNAIASGKVSHAYLFSGSRGTGKTSMARVFAMGLNCRKSKEPTITPCGECEICRDVQAGSDIDVQELDGASNNSVDNVRALRENARFTPNRARFRIYYIDEAHMLSPSAFNALLKTLEEPPAHVKFILATTAPSKIPETIHSRCQRFDFRRISAADIAKRLEYVCGKEKLKIPEEVLSILARRARGSMRDGLSLLDQVIAFAGEDVTAAKVEQMLGGVDQERMDALLGTLVQGDIAGGLRAASAILDSGCDVPDLLEQLAHYARALLIAAECGPEPDLLERAKAEAEKLVERSKAFSPDFLMYVIQALYEARQKARQDLDSRIVMELALVKIARAREMGSVEEMLTRLESLEGRLREGLAGREPRVPAGRDPRAHAAPAPQAAAYAGRGQAGQAPQPAEDDDAGHEPPRVGEPAASYSDALPLWQRLLNVVQANGNTWVRAQILQGRLKEFAGDRLVIGLPTQTAFKELDSARTRAELEAAFSRVVGRKISLSFVLEQEQARAPDAAAAQNEDLKGVAEMFGGQVIKRRKSRDG